MSYMICGCASPACMANGCQNLAAQRRADRYRQNEPMHIPIHHIPLQPLTADDVRRIVREELERTKS